MISKCEYTGELLIARMPIFGVFLPFIGWKWIPSDWEGNYLDQMPPRFVALKLGVMWFGHGLFYTPPWGATVRKIEVEKIHD